MKLTVLSDNSPGTLYPAEWGLSFLIQTHSKNILFDFGGSDRFIHNAAQKGVDLTKLEYMLLSHGHWDHSWGLIALLQQYLLAKIPLQQRPAFISHPWAFQPRVRDIQAMDDLGALLTAETISRLLPAVFTREPFAVVPNLFFLGEIERNFPFEQQPDYHFLHPDGTWQKDLILDDSALAYRSAKGLVIITGCAHSGICNTIEYARKVMHEYHVHAIVGGFHLLKTSPNVLESTVTYFEKLSPDFLYASHCTDLEAKIALSRVANLCELRVGQELEF